MIQSRIIGQADQACVNPLTFLCMMKICNKIFQVMVVMSVKMMGRFLMMREKGSKLPVGAGVHPAPFAASLHYRAARRLCAAILHRHRIFSLASFLF